MAILYYGLGFVLSVIIFTIQNVALGYEVYPPDFSLGMLLLAGPFEETLFFGIPFYLTNNHYVVLATGVIWAFVHVFNTDVATLSFEYLAYANLAMVSIGMFYSLRTWVSGKGWFSILMHSSWNFIVFIMVAIEGELQWSLLSYDHHIESEMLIFSVLLLAITYGLYRWKTGKIKSKRKSKIVFYSSVVGLGIIIIISAFSYLYPPQVNDRYYTRGTNDMFPAIEEGELMEIDKEFPFEDIRPRDIVAFYPPNEEKRPTVHRVILIINDEPLTMIVDRDMDITEEDYPGFTITEKDYIGKVIAIYPEYSSIDTGEGVRYP